MFRRRGLCLQALDCLQSGKNCRFVPELLQKWVVQNHGLFVTRFEFMGYALQAVSVRY